MPSVVVQAGDVGSGAATVKVYAADGTTLATVYKDANGDDTGANPLPKHRATGYFGLDNAGNYTVYLVPGDYQLGVTPAGGSETKTPFTVTAPVVEVETVFTEVFGTPADGDVPAWNDTTKRFEWAPAPAASSATAVGVFTGQASLAAILAGAGLALTLSGTPGPEQGGLTVSGDTFSVLLPAGDLSVWHVHLWIEVGVASDAVMLARLNSNAIVGGSSWSEASIGPTAVGEDYGDSAADIWVVNDGSGTKEVDVSTLYGTAVPTRGSFSFTLTLVRLGALPGPT